MRFFYGRYGTDALAYALIILSVVASVTSSLIGVVSDTVSYILWVLSYVILVFAVFRMLSRNYSARRRENDKFLALWKPTKKWFKLQYNRVRDFKTHKYFSCPKCKNNLRVPKGKGAITITCPVCKTKFDERT